MTDEQRKFFEILQKHAPYSIANDGAIVFDDGRGQREVGKELGFSKTTFNRLLRPDALQAPEDRTYLKMAKQLERLLEEKEPNDKVHTSINSLSLLGKLSFREILMLVALILAGLYIAMGPQTSSTTFELKEGLDIEGIKRLLPLTGADNSYYLGIMTVNLNNDHVRNKDGILGREDSLTVINLAIEDIESKVRTTRLYYDHEVFMTKAGINVYELLEMTFPSGDLIQCTPEEILDATINGSFPPCATEYDKGLLWTKPFLFNKDIEPVAILKGVQRYVERVQVNQLDSLEAVYSRLLRMKS